jgi:uncharacterized protein
MAFSVTLPSGLKYIKPSIPESFKISHDWPLSKAILVSWAIALLEYCLSAPANRLGYTHFSGFQLKIVQEVVTLVVFAGFAVLFLKEKLAWNYLAAFLFLGLAAFFAFCVQGAWTGSVSWPCGRPEPYFMPLIPTLAFDTRHFVAG